MKKIMLLTTALVVVSTCAFAKDKPKQVIGPEELFQLAKKECPELKNADELPALRACIAEKKGVILRAKDPRIAKVCGGYSGSDRDKCTDWLYGNGGTSWDPKAEALREGLRNKLGTSPLPAEDPNVVREGRQHQERERQEINRARGNDPRSNKSTITGRPGDHSGTVKGGGVSPENKVSRPNFLGGRTTGKKGGIELGGEVTGQPGDLGDVHDAVKELPR